MEASVERRGLAAAAARLLDLLFPLTCEGCGVRIEAGVVCRACGAARWRIAPGAPLCPACGRPYPPGAVAGVGEAPVCGRCRVEPLPLVSHRAGLLHEGPVRAAVAALKYRRRRDLAGRLAEWAWDGWEGCPGELLVPVPLAPPRLRARGFNQALLLARWAGRRWGMAVESRGLERRPGPPQVGLSRAARAGNVAGRFRVAEPERFRGASVVVVDDVFTTGATVAALARVLQRAGAAEVRAITVALRP